VRTIIKLQLELELIIQVAWDVNIDLVCEVLDVGYKN
jgi:hypothetical protein